MPPISPTVGSCNTIFQILSPEQALRGNNVDDFIESLSYSDFSTFSMADLQATILVLLKRNHESDRILLFKALPYYADLYSRLDLCAFIFTLEGELDEAIAEFLQDSENIPIEWDSICDYVCSEKNEEYDLVGLFSEGFREWRSKCVRNPKDHVEVMRCMGKLEKAAVRMQNNSPECSLEKLPTEVYDPFYVDYLRYVVKDKMWEKLTREPVEKVNTLFRWLLNLAHTHSRTDYVKLLYQLLPYISFEPSEWTDMKARMRELDTFQKPLDQFVNAIEYWKKTSSNLMPDMHTLKTFADYFPGESNETLSTLISYFLKGSKEIVKCLHESQPLSDAALDLFVVHFATLSVETRALFQPHDEPVDAGVRIINEPITTKELQSRIKHMRGVTSLDVEQLTVNSNFSIDLFAVCTKLTTLALRVTTLVTGVLNFTVGIQSLSSLTVTNAPLGEFFSTARNIPLRHLCIDASTVRCVNDLRFLNMHPTIRQLDMIGVHDTARHRVADTHVRLPNAKVVIKAPHVDLTDYKNLFSKRRIDSPFAINLQELATGTRAKSSLILTLVGDDEDENWEAVTYGSRVLKHNCCERLSFASPIKCLDKRVRVASSEPRKLSSIEEFWRYVVSDNVTLITMVKEIEADFYFPKDVGDELQFRSLSIECTSVERGKYYTERVFIVNGKTVHHLQIDWEDGSSIEVDTLLPILERIALLEEKNPGSSIYHCKAGYGRTGALFGALIIKQALDKLQILKQELLDQYFDPEIIVRGLRQQRKNMIQNGDQLSMLFKLVQALVKVICSI